MIWLQQDKKAKTIRRDQSGSEYDMKKSFDYKAHKYALLLRKVFDKGHQSFVKIREKKIFNCFYFYASTFHHQQMLIWPFKTHLVIIFFTNLLL